MANKGKREEIPLYPKYGLNPSIEVCFWCGDDVGTILLLGAWLKQEAPLRLVGSYDPCEKCSKAWTNGFVFFEASETPTEEDQPPLQPGIYPTGNYAVINPEAAKKVVGEEVFRIGGSFMSIEQFKLLTEKLSDDLPNEAE